ncbi:MAG: hypothetical protein ACXV7J_13460 [Methylomonas sp.]
MKTPKKSLYCSRCGDELSADEIRQIGGSICAFCDNIRAEALQMHELRRSKSKRKAIEPLHIVANSSDNLSIKLHSALLP